MPEQLTAPQYGREALRRLREQQAAAQQPERQPPLLEQIPVDAPMDDATLTVWNGERFVAYEKWLATAPLVVEEQLDRAAPEAGRTEGKAADRRPKDPRVQEGLW